MFVIIALVLGLRTVSYASYLWKNGEHISSVGVWLSVMASVILAAVYRQM